MDNIFAISITIIITVIVTAVIAAVYIEFAVKKRYEAQLNDLKNQKKEAVQEELRAQIEDKKSFWQTAFSHLLNSIPIAASVFSYDGKRYFVNKHFLTLFSVQGDLMTGLWNTPVISEKLKERVRNEDNFATKIEINFADPEVRKWFATGYTEPRYFDLYVQKFFMPDIPKPFIVFVCNDITELENARRKDRKITRLAQKLYNLKIIKVWRYYVDYGETEYFNEGGVISREDSTEFFAQFEPQDVVVLMNSFEKMIQGKTYDKKIVMRMADDSIQGGYSYWNTLTEAVYENGRVTKIEGLCYKITYQTLLKKLKIKDFRDSSSVITTKFAFEVNTGQLLMQGRQNAISFESYLKSVHPEDLKTHEKIISEIKAGKQIFTTISYRFKSNNAWHNVQLFITPSKTDENGKVTVFTGVVTTNQKWDDLISSVKDGEHFLKSLINAVPCMLAIKDADDDFRYILANKQYCDAFNLNSEMIIKHTDYEVFGHSRVTLMGHEADMKTIAEGSAEFEVEFEYDGTKFSMRYNKTLYIGNNKQRYIICCAQNISEYKSMIERLQAAKMLAEKSDNLKTTFLKNVSHEIRTPMNYITGFSALLIKNVGKKDFNSEEAYRNIATGCHELIRQVENLLDSSKMISGFAQLTYSKFDVSRLFKEIYQSFKQEVEIKNVKLLIDNPYPYCIINSDKKYIRKIIDTYVSNALKYTIRGYVKMGYKYQERGIFLYVEDTGCGILPADRDRVFLPFEKINEEKRGIGLGLPICKTIVDSAGGKIGFESQVKKGSFFWAWLPTEVNIFTLPPVNYESTIPAEIVSANKKYKILIAESDLNSYSLLENALGCYSTEHAFDGETLVEKALSKKYDLIITGVDLPCFSGLEAAQKIRKAGNNTPIAAIMEVGYHYDMQTALKAGCNESLAKPINIEKLKSILCRYGIE